MDITKSQIRIHNPLFFLSKPAMELKRFYVSKYVSVDNSFRLLKSWKCSNNAISEYDEILGGTRPRSNFCFATIVCLVQSFFFFFFRVGKEEHR